MIPSNYNLPRMWKGLEPFREPLYVTLGPSVAEVTCMDQYVSIRNKNLAMKPVGV